MTKTPTNAPETNRMPFVPTPLAPAPAPADNTRVAQPPFVIPIIE